MNTHQTAFGFAAEFDENLGESVNRFTAARWFGALFHLRVLADIWADVKQAMADCGKSAKVAASEDAQAAEIITQAMADGPDKSDERAIRDALKLVEASRKHDEAISRELTP